jgi:hypothetical protein
MKSAEVLTALAVASAQHELIGNLPTAWQQFFNSGFKYRPPKTMTRKLVKTSLDTDSYEYKTIYKTNSRPWAKQ